MTAWDEITAESAKRANEKLRQDGERYRQQTTNDTLGEIRDILKAMLDAYHEDAGRYREQAAHNADIARNLMNAVNDREEEIMHLKNEVFNLRERVRMYLAETRRGN